MSLNPNTVELIENEVAIFGYGSLLSVPSLETTLKRRYRGPFVACSIEGWRRSWNVAMPNQTFYAETPSGCLFPERIIYLNVTAQPSSLLNGVLFVVGPKELQAMDEREWIYDRLAITDQLRGVNISGGDAFTYVAKPEYLVTEVTSPAIAAIRASYLALLETGLSDLGSSFREAYEQSSAPVPRHLVIDDIRKE